MQSKDPPLPMLRSDLKLNEAAPEYEGAPTWTLYDPSANKYYMIGWLEFECLVRFRSCRTVGELIKKVVRETPLVPDADAVNSLIAFLMQNNLVVTAGDGASARFETMRSKAHKAWYIKMLHGYLFFTVPLVKPQAFLNKTFPIVRPLYTKTFFTLVLILLGYGIFLTFQRVDEFFATFMNYLNFEGILLLLTATLLLKVVHEMGHAYMATKYNVPVNVMGVAFMVMVPILYTETTNAWKLKDRRARLNIAASGVMAEMTVAAIALMLWHGLTPGFAQSLCFMMAFVSLVTSLAVNLNPLMRFDGYYAFSDIVGVDNLQDRSVAFLKWNLRRFLWGWKDEPPEHLAPERQRFLAIFGLAMTIYRFFLFLGIAILVYHVFFQPLGLILMIIELAFFIGLPIWRELKVWYARREEILPRSRGALGFYGLLAVLFIMVLPVSRSVEVPAVMHMPEHARLFIPIAAHVDEVLIAEGDKVVKGQSLFRMSSPQLDYNIQISSDRLKALYEIQSGSQSRRDLVRKYATLESEIETAERELQGYRDIQNQLDVKAPHDGVMRDVDRSIRPGQWVSGRMMLGLVVGHGTRFVLSGYIREQDIDRISKGVTGVFYPEFSAYRTYDVMLERLNEASVTDIHWPELSSVHNGPIPAERAGPTGERMRMLPGYTYYLAGFTGIQGADAEIPGFIARGTIRLEAAPVSSLHLLLKRVVSVIIQEGGF